MAGSAGKLYVEDKLWPVAKSRSYARRSCIQRVSTYRGVCFYDKFTTEKNWEIFNGGRSGGLVKLKGFQLLYLHKNTQHLVQLVAYHLSQAVI